MDVILHDLPSGPVTARVAVGVFDTSHAFMPKPFATVQTAISLPLSVVCKRAVA